MTRLVSWGPFDARETWMKAHRTVGAAERVVAPSLEGARLREVRATGCDDRLGVRIAGDGIAV